MEETAERSNDLPTEQRVWELAFACVQAIEAAWANEAARQRAILEARRWIEAQDHLPHLHKLAPLLVPEMDRRQLWSVLVPIERELTRRRVTDVEILEADLPVGDASPKPLMPLVVVVDNLRSALNLGGIFRTAECFGAAAVWTCGYTADPSQPRVAQAAMGCERLVPWQVWSRVRDALARLRQEGVACVALETVEGAAAPETFPWKFPCALLVGNERFGLDPETLRQVDGVVRIPVYGRKNSLNVASAFAVAAYAARVAWNAASGQSCKSC